MNEKLRIAHVVQNMNIGGLERLVAVLVRHMDSSRFDTKLYCLGDGGTLFRELEQEGHEVLALNKSDGLNLLLPLRLATYLRRDRIDIVHCHNWSPLVYGGIGGRLAGWRRVVYTAHGPEIPAARRRVFLHRLPVTDRIVAVSEFIRMSAIAKGVSPSSITTIRNGIDVERYDNPSTRAETRREIGASPDNVVLGVVARLSAEKDHRTLLEAFRIVHRERPEVLLIVIGDGVLREDLQEQAVQMQLGSQVKFLGTRHDVPALLSALDVFVLSSREEGLGITLLEAMAAGVPIVATAAGGIPEVVEHNKTGLLVPVGDARAFSDAVNWVLENPTAAREMAESGKHRVRSEFAFGHMVKQYEAVYRGAEEPVGARTKVYSI